jgi:hypothetical protein
MAVMRAQLTAGLVSLALGAGAGVTLAGCGGSSTKTESVAASSTKGEAPPATTTAGQTTTSAATRSANGSTGTASTPTSAAGGSAASETHTASEPEFAQQEAHGEGLNEAVSVLQSRGYAASDTSQYHADQTLRVLIGTKAGASGSYDEQAFFFVNGRYIGTDTKEPSASIKVVTQGDTEVTLTYALYRDGQPLAGENAEATVRFQLDDGKLTALDPIPPANSASAPGRL